MLTTSDKLTHNGIDLSLSHLYSLNKFHLPRENFKFPHKLLKETLLANISKPYHLWSCQNTKSLIPVLLTCNHEKSGFFKAQQLLCNYLIQLTKQHIDQIQQEKNINNLLKQEIEIGLNRVNDKKKEITCLKRTKPQENIKEKQTTSLSVSILDKVEAYLNTQESKIGGISKNMEGKLSELGKTFASMISKIERGLHKTPVSEKVILQLTNAETNTTPINSSRDKPSQTIPIDKNSKEKALQKIASLASTIQRDRLKSAFQILKQKCNTIVADQSINSIEMAPRNPDNELISFQDSHSLSRLAPKQNRIYEEEENLTSNCEKSADTCIFNRSDNKSYIDETYASNGHLIESSYQRNFESHTFSSESTTTERPCVLVPEMKIELKTLLSDL